MKTTNKLLITLSILLAVDLIAFGIVVFFDNKNEAINNIDNIRLGITPNPDRLETPKTIENFFKVAGKHGSFELEPCYTASYNEAISGFIHGSLDLLYINPAYYLYLKKNYNADIVAFQLYSKQEMEYNHAVLLSIKPFGHLAETRGKRISFSNKYSMCGYLVPERHLRNNITEPLETWFSKIDFSGSDQYSLDALLKGETDIIACDLLSLIHNTTYKKNARKLHLMWISQKLPESLICVSAKSMESDFYNRKSLVELGNSLWQLSRRETLYNRNSMNFEPPHFEYMKELDKLEKFLFPN